MSDDDRMATTVDCHECGEPVECHHWTTERVKCAKCGAEYEPETDYVGEGFSTWLNRRNEKTPPPR